MAARLVAAAFSAHLGVDIKCKDDANMYALGRPGQVDVTKIEMRALFSHSLDVIMDKPGFHCVRVFGRDRERYEIDLSPYRFIRDIKQALASGLGVHPSCQKLICQGHPLEDTLSLAQQGVKPGATMLMVKMPQTATEPDQAFYIDDNDLDPKYNYDFTDKIDSGELFERGGYPYTRPYGWNRAGLKVLGRYDDDVWLGTNGIRTDSSSGEWAVSYHGTPMENVRPISNQGYDSSRCERQAFGPGIYSTPSPVVAAEYAVPFSFNEKSYKMILQNRVDLNYSKIVSEDETGVEAAYFVTSDDDDVRPYGVCLKEF